MRKENQQPGYSPQNKSSFWLFFVVALVAAILGSLLTFGGVSLVSHFQNKQGNLTGANGDVQTSNIKANVTTNMTDAVAKVEDAVVSVVNLKSVQDDYGIFGTDSKSDSDDGDLTKYGEGSGVIYKKKDGIAYVVTNNHVVSGSDGIEVILKDGTKVKGKVIGTDAVTDLAVIQIKDSNVKKTASFGDSSALKVAEPVAAIGSPMGSQFATSVTQGIVSAKERTVEVGSEDGRSSNISVAIQTDAAINPGNSGGALINTAGQVIGINSMKLAGEEVEGMGFAIPSNEVVKIINQLEKDGKVVRPMLGVEMRDLSMISTDQQEILKLPKNVKEGAVITNTSANSPAKKAGLDRYDTIVEADGKTVSGTASLRNIINGKNVGDEVKIKAYREGKLKEFTVKLDKEQKTNE